MFCPKCGKEIKDRSVFCEYCGEKIKEKGELEKPKEVEKHEGTYEKPKLLSSDALSKDESIYFECRPDWFLHSANSLFVTFIGILFFFLATQVQPFRWIIFCIGILCILPFLISTLRWKFVVYALTTKRVIKSRGIIGKEYVDCPHDKVQNVFLKMSILQRILGAGTIRIATAGTAFVEIAWENVKNPRKVQKILNDHILR